MTIASVAMLHAMAQDVMISDAGQIPAFEGIIGFHIRYEGKVPNEMKAYLPDSMTMFVGQNALLYRYHGGEAHALQSQLIWDGDTQEFLLLDAKYETAESRSSFWKSLIPKAVSVPKESLTVAGKRCKVYTLTTEKKVDTKIEKQVEKIWVNDSIYFGGRLVDSLKQQQPNFLAAGMRQIPLQCRRLHAGELTTVLTAVSIQPAQQDLSLFKAPEAYRMKEFDPSKPWHPIIERKKE